MESYPAPPGEASRGYNRGTWGPPCTDASLPFGFLSTNPQEFNMSTENRFEQKIDLR